MAQYKVVNVTAPQPHGQGATPELPASMVEKAINDLASQGWELVTIKDYTTFETVYGGASPQSSSHFSRVTGVTLILKKS